MEKKGRLVHYWWKYKLMKSLCRIIQRFLKTLKTELPQDPAISSLGIYPKKTKTLIRKDTCIPMFIAAVLKQARYGSNLSIHQQKNK